MTLLYFKNDILIRKKINKINIFINYFLIYFTPEKLITKSTQITFVL